MFIQTEPLAPLLLEARRALRWTQAQLGEHLSVSRRTAARWEAGRTSPVPNNMHELARVLVPVDRALAERAAAAGGQTLEKLGLVSPAPPPAPVIPPPPRSMLVDSVVYVAAETLDASPKAIRGAVLAAVERALVLGVTLEEVSNARGGEGAPAKKTKGVKA